MNIDVKRARSAHGGAPLRKFSVNPTPDFTMTDHMIICHREGSILVTMKDGTDVLYAVHVDDILPVCAVAAEYTSYDLGNSNDFEYFDGVPFDAGEARKSWDSPEQKNGAFREAYTAKVCDECKGTGYYTSPITGKQSPCSKGCKQ